MAERPPLRVEPYDSRGVSFHVFVDEDVIGTVRRVEGGFEPVGSDILYASFQMAVGFLVFKREAEYRRAAERLVRALFYAQDHGPIECPKGTK